MPQGKLELLARGLSQRRALRRRAAHGHPPHARGLRRHRRRRELLRGRRRPPARARGHRDGRARARPARRRPAEPQRRKVSLRATDDRVDVSAIARAQGGGGHRRAAGFSTRLEFPQLVEFLRAEPRRAAVLSCIDGVILFDKPAGITSHDVVASVRRRLGRGRQGRPRGHARPVRDRAAARAGRARDARAALPDGAAQALRDRRAAGLDLDDRRPRRRARPGRDARRAVRAADRAHPPAPAGVLRGQGRRPARLRAGARRRGGRAAPSARWRSTRFELTGREDDRATFAIECSSGTYVRSLIADLGDAYCVELRRTAIGQFDVADADPERIVAARRRARLPARGRARGRGRARRAAHGVAVRRRSAAGTVRLLDADGLIALAEPRADGLLKPVVGFASDGDPRPRTRRTRPADPIHEGHLAPRRRAAPAPRRGRRVRRRAPRPPRGDRTAPTPC